MYQMNNCENENEVKIDLGRSLISGSCDHGYVSVESLMRLLRCWQSADVITKLNSNCGTDTY